MYSHRPSDYIYRLREWLKGNKTKYKQNNRIVLQHEFMAVFISPKWWVNNPWHVIIIPNKHYENIYEISEDLLSRIYIVAKKLALA